MKETAARYWTLFILLLGITLSLGAAWLLHYSEQEQLHHRFSKDVSDRAAVFGRELNTSLETLYTLRTLFISQAIPKGDDFEYVARNSRERHEDIVAFYWVPELAAQKREFFEQNIQQINSSVKFQVLQQDGRGLLRPSELPNGLHRPVAYYHGEVAQALPLGIDLRNNPSI